MASSEPAVTVVGAMSEDSERANILKLIGQEFLSHNHKQFFHGRLDRQDQPWKPPKVTWHCPKKPRDDHHAPDWLTASEYQDRPECLDAKVAALGQLLLASKRTVVYSGAGISVAAGIGQAARGNAKGGQTTQATPTFTHLALGKLAKAGLIHSWEQQNHDGLPQKAGVPQEMVNEIHGSWFDPSNPVVKYSGSLKDDNYEWLIADSSEQVDLVLVLGTSLGGLNADQVAINAAYRSQSKQSLGFVMINLQQTEQDGKSTLRVFGKTDDVFLKLLTHLGIPSPKLGDMVGRAAPSTKSDCWKAEVPYDKDGVRTTDGTTTTLDLNKGARIKLTKGHNVQGARQPMYMHIGAKKAYTYRGIEREPGRGNGSVIRHDPLTCSFLLNIDGASMKLGAWWFEAAKRGGPEKLPVVNYTEKSIPPRLTQQPKHKQRATNRTST